MTDKRVSVVITTYNGATRGYLRDAIDSVLAQSVQDFELILVDDGSTDGTPEVCRAYLHDDRIRYVRQNNKGVAAARNLGVSLSQHPLISFLDDDDAWRPGKLERQLMEFSSGRKNLGLVYTAIEIQNAGGTLIGLQRHAVPADPYSRLFYENFIDATSSVMVLRSAIQKVGLFRAEIYGPEMQGCEDRDLWIRIAREYEIAGIPDPLVVYRLHGQKLSRNLAQMERSEVKMLSLALTDAPDEIQARQKSIYANAMRRVAMEYFAIAEYGLFRERVKQLILWRNAGVGLLVRYLFSLSPAAVKLVRRITLARRRGRKALPIDG